MPIVFFLLVECGLLHPTTISYVIADGKLKNFLGGGMWESLYSADTVVPNKDVIMFCSYAPGNTIGGVFLTCCGFSPLPFLFCQ